MILTSVLDEHLASPQSRPATQATQAGIRDRHHYSSRGRPIPGFPQRLDNNVEDLDLTARELHHRAERYSIRAERVRRGERLSDALDVGARDALNSLFGEREDDQRSTI
jgi:hypothetical protein